jgi:acyl carrier protein phosphodiesterase
MNFLAHIYLSGDDPLVMLGNFIGDFVKGNQLAKYDLRIRNGVILHRAIDQYTDSHEEVYKSKKMLRSDYRHYAPVIVDVYYDHFLARYWQEYHPSSLIEFTENFYTSIKSNQHFLPSRAKQMFGYMSRDNWLLGYSFIEGVERALGGMARRTKFESGMDRAGQNLRQDYDIFKAHFESFFPQLISHARAVRSTWE